MSEISNMKNVVPALLLSLVLSLLSLLPGCAAGGMRGTGTTSFAGRILSSPNSKLLAQETSTNPALERVNVSQLVVLVEALDVSNSVLSDASTSTDAQGAFLVLIPSAERYRVTVQNDAVSGSTEVITDLLIDSASRNVDVDFSLGEEGDLEVLSVDISEPVPSTTPTPQPSAGSSSSGSGSHAPGGSNGSSSPIPTSSPTNAGGEPASPTPSPGPNQESEGSGTDNSGSGSTPTPSSTPSPTPSPTASPAETPSPTPGNDLVTICHIPGRTPQTLMVNQNAVAAHLNHGDSLGPCPGDG